MDTSGGWTARVRVIALLALPALLAVTGCAGPAAVAPSEDPAVASSEDVAVADPGTVDTGLVPPLHPAIDDWDETLVTIEGRDVVVAVKVAATPQQRARGLMEVASLPDGVGMLFVYDGPQRDGFWMKDTLVPLDIAFADERGTIVAVDTMVPCPSGECPTYDPGVAFAAALEVPAGWLDTHGIGPGDRLAW